MAPKGKMRAQPDCGLGLVFRMPQHRSVAIKIPTPATPRISATSVRLTSFRVKIVVINPSFLFLIKNLMDSFGP